MGIFAQSTYPVNVSIKMGTDNVKVKKGNLSNDLLEHSKLLSKKVEAFLWYDAETGILVKEEIIVDNEPVLSTTLDKTNIGLIFEQDFLSAVQIDFQLDGYPILPTAINNM